MIGAFTIPGEVVCDPFVGGGTTVAEARLTGRLVVGADLNALATFITKAKTAVHTEQNLYSVRQWANLVEDELNIHRPVTIPEFWTLNGYFRNLEGRDTWRQLKKLIAQALASLCHLAPGPRGILLVSRS